MIWGDTSKGNKHFHLHNGQRDILLADARFKAAIAGTGGGKTVLGPIWVAQQIERVKTERDVTKTGNSILGLIVAPTYPVMARATAPTLVNMFVDTDLEGKYVESKNRYYLPETCGNSAVIWMLSADSPGSLEGGQFDFAWIDEGGQISYEAWIAIQGRLGQRMGPVLITTTPYNMAWLYTKFFERAKNGDKDYFVKQWPSIANPAYPMEEYERAAKSMAPQRFHMRYDGKFVKLAGLVFPSIDRCFQEFDIIPPGEYHGGIDFGWNNPFAAVAGCLDPLTDKLYVFYERYKRFTTLPEHNVKLPKKVDWSADSSRPGQIRELRNGGLSIRPDKSRDIMLGVDAVNARIYTDRLVIHPKCRAIKAESEIYAYKEEDDETKGDTPVDDFNHALDALRYLVVNMDRNEMVA